LYEYLLHRVYNFDFTIRPNLIDKDSYFIPAGYDSTPVLNSFDLQGDLSKIYNERISNLEKKKNEEEKEIICDDTQKFLKKFYGENATQKAINPRNLMENVQKDKNNYATNQPSMTKEDSKKQLIKNISQGKFNSNIEHKDTASKEEMAANIKKQEMEKLVSKKDDGSSTVKPSANELLKKRLDALKSSKKQN